MKPVKYLVFEVFQKIISRKKREPKNKYCLTFSFQNIPHFQSTHRLQYLLLLFTFKNNYLLLALFLRKEVLFSLIQITYPAHLSLLQGSNPFKPYLTY